MFYSQFILAKKGPLGTIWIAAHLERKLRKNQVADTDIGVSVDSIIFPDVPIALRLSSHLLLGVVRIYSRKVNYLFDDCSEALLKVKQAFRSAAVDLPPEESTAPYHSITLPETFDLDDFELPDNEVYQGNYVDHHVSAKEQITLQDTMERVVYSTSQFGLDERFGDGDTSQIGLDLNEDDLLGKATTPMNDGVADDQHKESSPSMTPFEADENNDFNIYYGLGSTPENNGGYEVEAIDEKPGLREYAEAPATPMLVEELNLSNVQEALVSDDHLEAEAHIIYGELKLKQPEKKSHTDPAADSVDHSSAEGSLPSTSFTEPDRSVLSSSKCHNGIMDVLEGTGGIRNGIERIEGTSLGIDGQAETQNAEKLEARPDENAGFSYSSPVYFELEKQCSAVVDGAVTMEDSLKKSSDVLGSHYSTEVADGLEVHEEIKDQDASSVLQEDTQAKFTKGLHPCNSNVDHQDKSLFKGDKQCPATDAIEVNVDGNLPVEPALIGKVQIHAGELLDQFYKEANLDLPAPEKMLSVSDTYANKPNDLLLELTPNKEDAGEGTKQISGRKHDLTESQVTVHSLESFGLSRSKQTGVSIPDDDDLLSSILVGRRSSALKMKPTPAPLEIVTSKRPRIAQRASASKRKVHLDETMVLHGDMIRQQLVSTEELRRMRKKAPCTMSEVSMLRRQFLEDEIFGEPTLAGLSSELFYMHKETYDVSRTKICALDKVTAPAEATKESSVQSDVIGESEKRVSNGPSQHRDDGEILASETLQRDWIYLDDVFATDARIMDSEMLLGPMDVDDRRAEGADAVSQSVVSEPDMLVSRNLPPEDRPKQPDDSAAETNLMDKEGDDGTSHLSPEHILIEQSLGKNSSEANVLIEGKDVVPELPGDNFVSESALHSGICCSVDAESNMPHDHGDISRGTLLAEPEEHGIQMLVEENEDTEILKKPGDYAETDFPNSGLLKGDLGHSTEHVDTQCSPLIDIEGERLHEDILGWEEKVTDGHADLETMTIGIDTGSFPVIFFLCTIIHGVKQSMWSRMLPSALYIFIYLDFMHVLILHSTEFLNVDDDEVDEDNEHLSDAEDSRVLDNSGWSSRTRSVAKYLQTLFDKEAAVRGKSILPMDSLLAGKTRKEASRMFFESLVLKTRDYIQVEQEKPFDNINMKPRTKLMKSQF
ncbi:hypothetical protein SAY86_011654 [Trapa natans]|uniref:Sister chromatid cohesion 1 protein 4-like n=1 Tax=Trapa natans TaxID=22666 RepID=A0AAN7LZM6_TRANT|nr:hypothetical protein SAY86_011654 [Trapa natans]